MEENVQMRRSLGPEDFIPSEREIMKEYQCPLCLGIMIDPVADECGHAYCQRCYDATPHKNESRCPISGNITKLNPILFLNYKISNKIVLCINRIFNCSWEGKLFELDSHIANDCEKQNIICPHDKCGTSVFREDLNLHTKQCDYRLVKCDYCLDQIAYIDKVDHYSKCMKFPIQCTQSCDNMIERCEIENHIKNECENTFINCPFNYLGCKTIMKKKDLKNYLNENMSIHFSHFMKFTIDFNESLVKSMSSINERLDRHEALLKENLVSSINSIKSVKKKENIKTENLLRNKRQRGDEENNDDINSQDKNIFDLYDKKKIYINKNQAKFKSEIREHSFLLLNYDISEKPIWRISFNNSEWIGFGCCNREAVKSQDLIFRPNLHNSFLYSTNGYTWNNNYIEENDVFTRVPCLLMKENVMKIEYSKEFKELHFYLNRLFICRITNVEARENDVLVPCVLFLNNGDEITADI